MATKIDISGLANTVTAFVATDDTLIKIGGKTLKEMGVTVTAGTSITIPNYGVLSYAGAAGTFTFKASSDAVGSFQLSGAVAGQATFTGADFSSATNASLDDQGSTTLKTIIGGGSNDVLSATTANDFKGGAGNDSITASIVATIDGGAGNDTLIGTLATNMTGGDGADLFQGAAGKLITVNDYKYAQGDVIKMGVAFVPATDALSNIGKFTTATGIEVVATVDATDNVFKAKITDTTKTKEFWTAQSGTSSVTMDASGIASTVTGGVVIDAKSATNAVVKGSQFIDAIDITGSKVTLQAGSAGNADVITGFNGGFSGDVLNLTDASIMSVVWGATGGGTKIGATTLTGAGLAADNGQILVQAGSGTAQKVAFAGKAGGEVLAAGADIYMGSTDGLAVLDVSTVTVDGTAVNLADTAKYKNIAIVDGAINAEASYVGVENTATTLVTTDGTIFNLNAALKASQVWGGNSANDTINLNGNVNVADTVWFGLGDGNDQVSNFKTGFAATADVLKMHNVSNLTDLTFAADGAGTGVLVKTAASNSIDLLVTSGTTTQLKLQNSAGDVKKVAVGYGAVGTVATINGVGAELVIGHKNAAGFAQDQVDYGATQTTDAIVNLQDATTFKNIKDVDMTSATGAYNAIVGSSTVASTLTTATISGAVNDIWGGSVDPDTFVLGATHQAKNTIWFGTIDGADNVTGFDRTKDKIRLHDRTIAQIAGGYTYDSVAGDLQYKLNAGNKLKLNAGGVTGATTIIDKNGTEYAAVLGTAGAAMTYDAAKKLYIGKASSLTVTGSSDVVFDLANGVSANVNDIYFAGVNKIDASGATGQSVMIGVGTESSTLIGGTGVNAMWGGGAAADEMKGGIAADQYWFGAGDGMDKVTANVDKNDTVVLYNATSISDVTLTANATAGTFTITAKDGSTLTVTDNTTTNLSALDGGLTFQFGVNEAAKNYTYNRISNTFVAK